jgi:sulfonate transport system permease protein
MPHHVIGLRNGLGLGWMFVVAAEFLGASEGLGYLLVDGQQTGRPAVIIASIVMFALLGRITDRVLAAVGGRYTRWQDGYVRVGVKT